MVLHNRLNFFFSHLIFSTFKFPLAVTWKRVVKKYIGMAAKYLMAIFAYCFNCFFFMLLVICEGYSQSVGGYPIYIHYAYRYTLKKILHKHVRYARIYNIHVFASLRRRIQTTNLKNLLLTEDIDAQHVLCLMPNCIHRRQCSWLIDSDHLPSETFWLLRQFLFLATLPALQPSVYK